MAIDFTFAENADVGVWFSQYFGDIAKLHVFRLTFHYNGFWGWWANKGDFWNR